jgi:hypothetical protein
MWTAGGLTVFALKGSQDYGERVARHFDLPLADHEEHEFSSSGMPPNSRGRADGAAGLIPDPGHCELIGAHVRARDAARRGPVGTA